MEKNITERMQMVKCMEFIARQLNDEDIFFDWLSVGVADGDIPYGDLTIHEDDESEWYTDDETFADLMGLFLRLMTRARKSGGLYCGDVVSSDK